MGVTFGWHGGNGTPVFWSGDTLLQIFASFQAQDREMALTFPQRTLNIVYTVKVVRFSK